MTATYTPNSFEDFYYGTCIPQWEYVKQLDSSARFGQVFYNTLHSFRKDLAEQIHGTELDPFYKQHVPQETLAWVVENWSPTE